MIIPHAAAEGGGYGIVILRGHDDGVVFGILHIVPTAK